MLVPPVLQGQALDLETGGWWPKVVGRLHKISPVILLRMGTGAVAGAGQVGMATQGGAARGVAMAAEVRPAVQAVQVVRPQGQELQVTSLQEEGDGTLAVRMPSAGQPHDVKMFTMLRPRGE